MLCLRGEAGFGGACPGSDGMGDATPTRTAALRERPPDEAARPPCLRRRTISGLLISRARKRFLSGKISSQSGLLNGGNYCFFGLADNRLAARRGRAMKTGLVKWFNVRKGYGFIKPVDGDLTSMFTSTRSGAPGGWSSRRGRRSVSIPLSMSAQARLSPRT